MPLLLPVICVDLRPSAAAVVLAAVVEICGIGETLRRDVQVHLAIVAGGDAWLVGGGLGGVIGAGLVVFAEGATLAAGAAALGIDLAVGVGVLDLVLVLLAGPDDRLAHIRLLPIGSRSGVLGLPLLHGTLQG